jgi:hypothetical protein
MAVERLGGWQSQYTPSPYLSLSARLEGVSTGGTDAGARAESVVKSLLLRGTLHVVTPGDLWAFAAARRAFGADYWPPAYERIVSQERIRELAQDVLAGLRAGPVRYEEVRALLEPHATDKVSALFLWRRIQGQVEVVHAPPSGTWGSPAVHRHPARRASAWSRATSVRSARRRSRASGSGQASSGSGRSERRSSGCGSARSATRRGGRSTRASCPATRPGDRRPAAANAALRQPRPRPRRPHAHPRRCPGDTDRHEGRARARKILVDGFVAGTWQRDGGRRVRLEPFAPLPRATRTALRDEIARVESFVA